MLHIYIFYIKHTKLRENCRENNGNNTNANKYSIHMKPKINS